MNGVTLIHIVSWNSLILLELDDCLLIFLLMVINSELRRLVYTIPTRELVHIRRGNLNIDAPSR